MRTVLALKRNYGSERSEGRIAVIGPAAFSVIVLAGYAPGFAAIAAASGLVGLALLVTRARLNRA